MCNAPCRGAIEVLRHIYAHYHTAEQPMCVCEDLQLLFDASAFNNGCLQLRNVIRNNYILYKDQTVISGDY